MAAVIMPRGIVFKLEYKPILRTVFLRRNDVLLAEVEWDWTEKMGERFIFPEYEAAERKRDELAGQGEEHVHCAVLSEIDEKLRRDREARHQNAALQSETESQREENQGIRESGKRALKSLPERIAIAKRGARARARGRCFSESAALKAWEDEHDA